MSDMIPMRTGGHPISIRKDIIVPKKTGNLLETWWKPCRHWYDQWSSVRRWFGDSVYCPRSVRRSTFRNEHSLGKISKSLKWAKCNWGSSPQYSIRGTRKDLKPMFLFSFFCLIFRTRRFVRDKSVQHVTSMIVLEGWTASGNGTQKWWGRNILGVSCGESTWRSDSLHLMLTLKSCRKEV